MQFLFNPERAARLIEFHARNAENPGLEEVLDTVLKTTWKTEHGKGYLAELANTVDNVVLYDLMTLSANERASDAVRAVASLKLHTAGACQQRPSCTCMKRTRLGTQREIGFVIAECCVGM